MLVVLALMTLACVFVGTRSQAVSKRVVIHDRLPTLTSTPLPTLTPTAISSSIATMSPEAAIAPPILAPTPAPALIPTLTPASNDLAVVTSPAGQNAGGAFLTALIGLNVRTGPGVDYPIVGKLAQSQSAQIVGKNSEGTWWQIVYPPESGSLAWVSADAQYSTVSNAGVVQIAQLPPPPPPPPPAPATPTIALAAQPTQAPLPTGNPTAASTATPISNSSGWAFAGVRLYPDQNEDGLLMYGDMINNTGTTQGLAYVTGTFYDAQGQVIAGEDRTFDYWPVEAVPPTGQVPFELTVDGIQNAAKFDLSVKAEPISDTPRQDFEFLDVNQRDEDGAYCLEGKLRNPGDELQDYLVIVAVLYDNQDTMINFSDYTEFGPTEVRGDQTLDFEICADTLNQPVARYELRAWGL